MNRRNKILATMYAAYTVFHDYFSVTKSQRELAEWRLETDAIEIIPAKLGTLDKLRKNWEEGRCLKAQLLQHATTDYDMPGFAYDFLAEHLTNELLFELVEKMSGGMKYHDVHAVCLRIDRILD